MKLIKKYQQFVKFCFLALCYNAVAYLTYAGLLLVNCYYLIASTVSFIVGISLSYFMNKRIVFNNKANQGRLLIHYFIYYFTLLGINLALLYAFINWLNFNPYIAQIIVTMISALVSYNTLKALFSTEDNNIRIQSV